MKKLFKKYKILFLLISFIFMLDNVNILAISNEEIPQFVTEDVSGRVYYIKNNNKALHWHEIDNKMYYFGEDGAMAIGWQYVQVPYNGVTKNIFQGDITIEIGLARQWFYFDENGVALKNAGMHKLSKRIDANTNRKKGDIYYNTSHENWYYFNGDSFVTGWLFYNNDWYYMKPYAQGFFKSDNTPIFPIKEGAEMFYGWLKYDDIWYYLDTHTGRMATGWLKDNNIWYYLSQSGDMKTGWLKDNNNWYYLNYSGAMVTGWIFDNGHWYYLSQNGAMRTGWYQVDNKWYYSVQSGELVTNSVIDGYSVNHNGEWIK